MRTSSFDLTAGDGQLLAEQVDPGVLGEGVHVVDAQDLDNATNHAVEEEAERPGVAGSPFRSWLVKPRNELLDLSRRARHRHRLDLRHGVRDIRRAAPS
jgi:hypothetical protein